MGKPHNILVTGSQGQIGQVIVAELRNRFGDDAVIATDIRDTPTRLDVRDADAVKTLIARHKPDRIYHLAAILSATAEKSPQLAWEVNLDGFINVLNAAVECGVERVFFPSTIAVYGPDAPRAATPDHAPTRPTTIYGIAKAAGENLAAWYRQRHNLDVRTLRYPGLIGWESEPGGGTTDYAVDIFRAASRGERFVCPLAAHRALPMMALPDAIRGTIEFMEAPREQILRANGYNLGGFSAAPQDFAAAIARMRPDFEVDYDPDHRDAIAASWPEGLDDSAARADWGWAPEYDLDTLAAVMLAQCAARDALRAAERAMRSAQDEPMRARG